MLAPRALFGSSHWRMTEGLSGQDFRTVRTPSPHFILLPLRRQALPSPHA